MVRSRLLLLLLLLRCDGGAIGRQNYVLVAMIVIVFFVTSRPPDGFAVDENDGGCVLLQHVVDRATLNSFGSSATNDHLDDWHR